MFYLLKIVISRLIFVHQWVGEGALYEINCFDVKFCRCNEHLVGYSDILRIYWRFCSPQIEHYAINVGKHSMGIQLAFKQRSKPQPQEFPTCHWATRMFNAPMPRKPHCLISINASMKPTRTAAFWWDQSCPWSFAPSPNSQWHSACDGQSSTLRTGSTPWPRHKDWANSDVDWCVSDKEPSKIRHSISIK